MHQVAELPVPSHHRVSRMQKPFGRLNNYDVFKENPSPLLFFFVGEQCYNARTTLFTMTHQTKTVNSELRANRCSRSFSFQQHYHR